MISPFHFQSLFFILFLLFFLCAWCSGWAGLRFFTPHLVSIFFLFMDWQLDLVGELLYSVPIGIGTSRSKSACLIPLHYYLSKLPLPLLSPPCLSLLPCAYRVLLINRA
ncbi:hypothetical protein BKA66DRAFT_71407 [Pyrenochaeta sp. MPI-SDFR-AT-0127]|nr:hypothetical protein BKA66DRAFT_71407 [Pyrenochaeta sp. MPI-SDFR-AT-0127]